MPHGKPRDPCKEQRWRQLIDQWQRSGLSVRAFCQRQHLAVPTFYAGRRTLASATAWPVRPARRSRSSPSTSCAVDL